MPGKDPSMHARHADTAVGGPRRSGDGHDLRWRAEDQGLGGHPRADEESGDLRAADSNAAQSSVAEASLPGLGLNRRHLAFVAGTLIAIWILFVFARAVSDAASITAQEARLRAENAGLQAQVAARQAELSTIQSPAFVALEARAYGYGAPDEQVFALRPGAPPPPHIAPLGVDPSAQARQTPFDAWMQLLFAP